MSTTLHSWHDHITNATICAQTGLTSIAEFLSQQQASLFGHVTRLKTTVPVHQAMWWQRSVTIRQNPSASRCRSPGCPTKTWITQIQHDVGMAAHSYWDVLICSGHGRVKQWSRTMRRWWWWPYGWLGGSVVEHRSLTGELHQSAADG